MAVTAIGRVRAVAGSIHRSRAAEWSARCGLAARAFFYLLLGYLALRVAFLPSSATSAANAHGALATVAATVFGKIAITAAAAGFAAFALARLSAAVRDQDGPRWRRYAAAIQGVVYLALAYVPISFLIGDHSTGSERQQHQRTAELLGFPGGRELVVAIGLVVIGVCVWQICQVVLNDPNEDLDLAATSATAKRVIHVVGTVGLVARAMVFLPIGGFLIVAAIRYDPSQADGLDGELLALSGHAWGTALIVLAAAGLLAFATFSAVQARYQEVTKVA